MGGLFAPSLFLGALVGDIVGHCFGAGEAGASTFAVVGGAAVLGAACRAPLTAITLMVEITRDTGLLVPLLAAIGTASLVTDYAEGAFSRWLEAKLVEMYLKEKALFWGAGLVAEDRTKGRGSGPTDTGEGLARRRNLPAHRCHGVMTNWLCDFRFIIHCSPSLLCALSLQLRQPCQSAPTCTCGTRCH